MGQCFKLGGFEVFQSLGTQFVRIKGAWNLWKHMLLLLKGLKLIYIQHH